MDWRTHLCRSERPLVGMVSPSALRARIWAEEGVSRVETWPDTVRVTKGGQTEEWIFFDGNWALASPTLKEAGCE